METKPKIITTLKEAEAYREELKKAVRRLRLSMRNCESDGTLKKTEIELTTALIEVKQCELDLLTLHIKFEHSTRAIIAKRAATTKATQP